MAEVLANTWRGDFQYIALSCVIWNLSEMGPIVTQHYFFGIKTGKENQLHFSIKPSGVSYLSWLCHLHCSGFRKSAVKLLAHPADLCVSVQSFRTWYHACRYGLAAHGALWCQPVQFDLFCFHTCLVRVQKLLVMFRKRLWFGFTSFTKVSLLFPHTMQQVGNEYN